MFTNVVDIPKLNDKQLISEYEKLIADYKCELKRQALFNEAIERWRNSKEPHEKRKSHITNLMIKLNNSFKFSDDLKANCKIYQLELIKRKLNFEKLP